MAEPGDRTQTPGMSPAPHTAVRAGPPRQSALWLWACVSAGMHVALFLLTSFGVRGAGLFGGAGLRDGDGFGGTSIEMEIAGPEDLLPQGGISAGSLPTTPEPVAAEESAGESAQAPAEGAQAMLQGELPVRAEPEEERAPSREAWAERERPARARAERDADPLPSRDLPQRGDPREERLAAAGPVSERPSGTDAEDSTAGAPAGDATSLILGSAGALGDAVAARRALLPNGGVCSDPVAGVWRAQKYRSSDRSWVRFILRIQRQGEALTGTITSRIWTGTPSNPQPGQCVPGGFDHTWRMVARGEVDGTEVSFGSRAARMVEAHCPSVDPRYAPDRFRGTIRPLSETFQSVNNDGAFDIDEPYTFRRVSCE